MTEAEWLTCDDPPAMLKFLEGRASERKLRLFAVACCRRYEYLLAEEESRMAIRVAERFADGQATPEEMDEAQEKARWPAKDGDGFGPLYSCYFREGQPFDWEAAAIVMSATLDRLDDTRVAAGLAGLPREQWGRAGLTEEEWAAEFRGVADLLRCIFGNPFRPTTINPAWLSPDVVSLAQTIYDDRDFDVMPILSDALEKSGCQDADILGHLRLPGEHARGCWAIDPILGKM